jgi:uncharacterized glyoxalase superfamily protein PhnB
MSASAPVRSAIIPCLRYDDAPEAILFLCDAFGFLPHAIYADEEDQQIIHHAQLVLGDSMVMLGSVRDDDAHDRYRWITPKEAGGITQCIHVVVADPDAHHAKAAEAGAEILTAPHDNEGYPGRGYDALDPEGHVWSFSDHDPWAKPEDA